MRCCPHHGIPKATVLGLFYRGALEEYRRALDTASYENFASLTVDQGEQLIENLAQSEASYGGDYDRVSREPSSSSSDRKYQELNEKIDRLSKLLLGTPKPVNFVGEAMNGLSIAQEGGFEMMEASQEECSYMGNQNAYQDNAFNKRPYNAQWTNNNNLSYRSNNVANPQDQHYPPRGPQGNQYNSRPYGNQPQGQNSQWRYQGGAQPQNPANLYSSEMKVRPMGQPPRPNAFPQPNIVEQEDIRNMLRQVIEGQAKAHTDLTERFDKFERKINTSHEESQAKFEYIYSHLKSLDNQVSQIASSSQWPQG